MAKQALGFFGGLFVELALWSLVFSGAHVVGVLLLFGYITNAALDESLATSSTVVGGGALASVQRRGS